MLPTCLTTRTKVHAASPIVYQRPEAVVSAGHLNAKPAWSVLLRSCSVSLERSNSYNLWCLAPEGRCLLSGTVCFSCLSPLAASVTMQTGPVRIDRQAGPHSGCLPHLFGWVGGVRLPIGPSGSTSAGLELCQRRWPVQLPGCIELSCRKH